MQFLSFFGKVKGNVQNSIFVKMMSKRCSEEIFLSCLKISAIHHRDKPFELGIPILVNYNHLKWLVCISKSGDFKSDCVHGQKRSETAIFAYFENL